MIRKGSTVSYKSYDSKGHKECGIGKVIEIDRVNGLCTVADYYNYYVCLISDCENTNSW